MKSKFKLTGSRVWRRALPRCLACIAVIGLAGVLLGACGATGGKIVNGSTVLPEFFEHLNACLKKQGIANPEASARAADAEHTIPALVGVAGIPIPNGVAKTQYEATLKRCGVTNVSVGRVAITNTLLEQRITSLRLCLANNGFMLPPPNFPGPGPVLDTSGVDLGSARWVATAMGCSVTRNLTAAALSGCVGDAVLAGRATGPSFDDRLLALPACLKRAEM
jgi:hypothetical protein